MVGDGSGGRAYGSGSEPLPPAVTQWNHREQTAPKFDIAPPFVPGSRIPANAAESVAPAGDITPVAETSNDSAALPPEALEVVELFAPSADLESSPSADLEGSPSADLEGSPADTEAPLLELTDPFAADPDALPELMPWEAPAIEPLPWESAPAEPPALPGGKSADDQEEGVVEPAFQEDVNVTPDAILDATHEEEFPMDAFIIPEHSRRVPTGVPDPDHTNQVDPTRELAERFEKLSRRLRAEDIDSLLPSLARGDRFDALVAGFIAGYFSARNI